MYFSAKELKNILILQAWESALPMGSTDFIASLVLGLSNVIWSQSDNSSVS